MSIKCLICGLNPITRADLDGLCVSCRAAVALGPYRIVSVEQFDEDELERYCEDGARRIHLRPRKFKRLVEFLTIADHPLGTEFPHHIDPIEYRPEDLPARWRALDLAAADRARAETVLFQLTEGGAC